MPRATALCDIVCHDTGTLRLTSRTSEHDTAANQPQAGCGQFSDHFDEDRVGTPFPLIKSYQNAWERRSHC